MDYNTASVPMAKDTLGPAEYADMTKSAAVTSEELHKRILSIVQERDQLRAQVRELSDRIAAINRNLIEIL